MITPHTSASMTAAEHLAASIAALAKAIAAVGGDPLKVLNPQVTVHELLRTMATNSLSFESR